MEERRKLERLFEEVIHGTSFLSLVIGSALVDVLQTALYIYIVTTQF
jgi:hypothetical protein